MALGDRAGESQRLLLPEGKNSQARLAPQPPGGNAPADRFCFLSDIYLTFYLIFISYQVMTVDPSSQKQLSFGE